MKKENNKKCLQAMRHSCEHVLTQAMLRLYPGIKMAMGPATEEGFYFDFDPSPLTCASEQSYKISETAFPRIEEEIKKIIKENLPIKRKKISIEAAQKLFKENQYKQEWLDEIALRQAQGKKEKAVVYWTGKEFVDLCSGPHVKSTGEIGPFKLLKIAGAYWRGDEKNKMLTRIYGTCFPTKGELDDYLWRLKQAKKRDHRKLGRELDLYSISPLTGAGLILWHPKLSIIRNIIEQFWKEEHIKRGYNLVYTPHIATMDMFVKTRHYTKYIDFMFPIMFHQYIEGESKADYTIDEQLKPMNCPNHIEIFKSRPRSYKELPLRMAELGTVYRYERAGVLHGLTRVRGFTQDDSHIFCTPDQVIEEVRNIIKLTRYFYEKIFGFKDYQAYLATQPEKYLGTKKDWGFAQDSLKKAMEAESISYKIDEGQGVFYGPKIDSKIKDSLGREWQLGTIQFDFNLPSYSETSDEEIEQFWKLKTFKDKFKTKEKLTKYLKKMGRGLEIKYVDKDGKEKQVVMIHRTVLGSMERFFGILIEHYAGAFPLWLAPVQVKIIPIANRHRQYGQQILQKLSQQEIRAELDDRKETMEAKIRDATLQKIPFMIIIGDREVQSSKEWSVSIRTREGKDLGRLSLAHFLSKIKEKIEKKV